MDESRRIMAEGWPPCANKQWAIDPHPAPHIDSKSGCMRHSTSMMVLKISNASSLDLFSAAVMSTIVEVGQLRKTRPQLIGYSDYLYHVFLIPNRQLSARSTTVRDGIKYLRHRRPIPTPYGLER